MRTSAVILYRSTVRPQDQGQMVGPFPLVLAMQTAAEIVARSVPIIQRKGSSRRTPRVTDAPGLQAQELKYNSSRWQPQKTVNAVQCQYQELLESFKDLEAQPVRLNQGLLASEERVRSLVDVLLDTNHLYKIQAALSTQRQLQNRQRKPEDTVWDCGQQEKAGTRLCGHDNDRVTRPGRDRLQSETTRRLMGDQIDFRTEVVLHLKSASGPSYSFTSIPATTMSTSPGPASAVPSASVQSPLRPALTLSMFVKPWFGGSYGAAAKPNVVAWEPVQPLSCTTTPGSASPAATASVRTTTASAVSLVTTSSAFWYEPPVPSLIYHQAPPSDSFFTHRPMVWIPHHLWKVRVFCPTCGKQLTGYGVHKRACKVLDIDRYYLNMTETLRCTVCRLNYLSSSQTVLDQLDLPHRKAVDEHNVPGMDRVDSLAEYLVELRTQTSLTLNNHQSPKKQGKGTLTRWTLILQDYRKICQLILANRAIMQDTTLQLVEGNQTTLPGNIDPAVAPACLPSTSEHSRAGSNQEGRCYCRCCSSGYAT
ncbi:hypothetical protein AAFF_G00086480 [Aldrovandia affinis]|uniref:DUF6729 domain-containing protein n=1 Tax=Aldrovandia affinis TaxID=143900 RepID=A0AAD7RWZ1_9TELE|nr:hypothetical protein AAFF_G00086480 [Aldrovandia affinis]